MTTKGFAQESKNDTGNMRINPPITYKLMVS